LTHSGTGKPPGPLYHYTSQQAFLSVIKNRSLWASHIRYLNDSKEFLHAFSVLEDVSDDKHGKAEDPLEKYFFSRLGPELDALKDIDSYVFCFSENGDLLSQWRGYTPNGSGFAFAFQTPDLRRWAESQRFRLAPCIYDLDQQRALIGWTIDEILKEMREQRLQMEAGNESSSPAPEGYWENFTDSWIRHFTSMPFADIAPLLKHPSFSEEREWRLVTNLIGRGHENVGFRAGIATITPYFEFRIGDDQQALRFADIKVGPSPFPDLAVKSLELLFAKSGIDDQKISLSEIPFRDW
jgi:hypothetical protein